MAIFSLLYRRHPPTSANSMPCVPPPGAPGRARLAAGVMPPGHAAAAPRMLPWVATLAGGGGRRAPVRMAVALRGAGARPWGGFPESSARGAALAGEGAAPLARD